MKRLVKLLLNLILALIAAGLTLVIIFFITPSWQTALVESGLSKDSARKWQVETVRLLPISAEAEGVYVLDGPFGGEIKFLEITGPLWKFPFTGVLEVEKGTILGLDLDLSQIRVGDLTSEDYQSFLGRVAEDKELWEERIGVILGKLAVQGWRIHLKDTQISGRLLMPGNKVVPVRWRIIEADSAAPRLIRVEPFTMLPEKTL